MLSDTINQPQVYISYGELYDKVSILLIKSCKVKCPQKRINIHNELKMLLSKCVFNDKVTPVFINLLDINNRLWETEDQLRIYENEKIFDERFVYEARQVYKLNHKRYCCKQEIDQILSSKIIEEKEHPTVATEE